ncbi:CUB domain protein [Onchocerca flexuosa]|uniref:CUB domain protein n=1 Tax=Onchocerca flexuosa TaxID=387005 RepID=A0A238BRQ9_9BILA|nr:CUB domain protein [Onchocerca flexuosa]
MRKFCDRVGQPVWILTENEIVDITFSSKVEPENHFWLSWSNEGCGGDITSPTIVIVDVDKLVNNSKIYECTWKIVAHIGMRVLFHIEKLSIFDIIESCTGNDSEQFSGIAFYSGTSNATGFAQKVICSSREDDNYTSHTNELFVKFKIPSTLAKPDVKKRVMTGKILFVPAKAGDECGAIIEMKQNEMVQLHSPNYPNLYPKSIECIWLIKAPSGYSIQFNLTQYTALNYHPQQPDMRIWRSNFNTNVTHWLFSKVAHMTEPICQGTMNVLTTSVFYGQHIYLRLDQLRFNKHKALKARNKSSAIVTIYDGAQEDASILGIYVGCGGTIHSIAGVIYYPFMENDFECEWFINNTEGNKVELEIFKLKLPFSEYCAESYLEVRENNNSGKIMTRACSFEDVPMMASRAFWIRLRYSGSEDDSGDIEPLKPELMIKFKKVFGGVTNNAVVSSPAAEDWQSIDFAPLEWILIGEEDNWLRISIKSIEIPDERDESNIDIEQRDTLKGLVNPFAVTPLLQNFVHNISQIWVRNLQMVNSQQSFHMRQLLILQVSINTGHGGYANGLKCRWTIIRPMFAGLRLKIISMDLEEHVDCRFDYVAISSDVDGVNYENGQLIGNIVKFCKHKDVGTEELFSSEDAVTIFFMTDRNRVCQSFDYIPASLGVFNRIIQSPNYPNEYSNNLSCSWSVMLESNRPILAKFLIMDIEESALCTKDNIIVHSNPIYLDGATSDDKLCGNLTGWNKTFPNGRVFISFTTDSNTTRKGFALQLMEQIYDCSSDQLVLTEDDSPKVLSSPGFPKMSPNSLDCIWTISASGGHRIKFTVDPISFSLEDTTMVDACTSNYLEIRDGPSKLSALIGRYCGKEPPSTIFSTGSYLNIHYQTDSFAHFAASCGGSVVIPKNGNRVITSPNYPEPYPSQATCEWTVVAPRGHYVNATFDHLWILFTENCTEDSIALRERDSTECGGDIIDDSGYITTPGYPNQLQAHIICEWTFRAGIGFRYVFDFAFVKHENFYQTTYNEVNCYPDIYITNGLNKMMDYYGFVDRNFCSNETRFVSTADLVTIRYNDRAAAYEKQNMRERGIPPEKIYAPFRISYFKVTAEFDENACMYHVKKNRTIELKGATKYPIATASDIGLHFFMCCNQTYFILSNLIQMFR